MRGPWLSAGRDYELFWRLTPAEISILLDADRARLATDAQRVSAASHELAHLIAFAFHDPKNIPAFGRDIGPAGEPKKEVSTEVDDVRVRAFFIGMSHAG